MFVRMYTACLMCRAIRRSSRTASARSCCLGVGCRSPARAGVVHRGIPGPCIARQRVAPKMNIVRKIPKTVEKITKTRQRRPNPTHRFGRVSYDLYKNAIHSAVARTQDRLFTSPAGKRRGLASFFPLRGVHAEMLSAGREGKASSVRAEGTAQRASIPNISKKRARMKDLG